jgi:antitoxin MazE
MRTQVRRIGNSLGNIIPAAFIKQLGLVEGADIEVKADGQKITIEPIKHHKKRFPFSEKDLLKGLDAHTAHADEIAIVSAKELGE